MPEQTFFLGIDLGSISLDAVVLDPRGDVAWSCYRRVHGRSREAIALMCRELVDGFMTPNGVASFAGAVAAGSGKEIVAELLDVPVINEIVAHGTAAAHLAGGRAAVIEIGGQDSKFILVDEHGPYDYAMNELCAAGTGAFLDVQAERLGLPIEEFSRMAAAARRVPAVAGRCSVFAKSDIIHLQQRGTPVDEIVAGLCWALARNFVATLIRGREVTRPVVFQGGVALNDGVVRAFRELLGLGEKDFIRPERPDLMGALGAALLARDGRPALEVARIASVAARPVDGAARAVELSGWGGLDQAAERQRSALEEFELVRPEAEGPFAIGIDVGSVSTDVVATTLDGELVAHVYTFTAGRPLEAVRRGMEFLGRHLDASRVRAVGTTGSGRRLAGYFVGADLVVDEITAQARGAHRAFPDADTVVEIGGQDAKFILLDEHGFVRDFEMNRACSAGTGSFLQEQAVRLDVDLKRDFARLALEATEGVGLASRCTVFMESDLVHHVQRGAALPGILRGIAEAVLDNYMVRVARGRRPGNRIVLQGGVAKNAAVVDAFRRRFAPASVTVHPTPGLSGALGAAIMAVESVTRTKAPTQFRSFAVESDFKPGSFGCRFCENRCEVTVFETGSGKFYFGDLCGRYAETLKAGGAGHDHTEVRETMLRALVRSASGSQTIGVPEALLFREYFPFWFAFFGALDVKLVTSGPTTSAKLHAGLARLPAETCLPVKLLFGHVAELVKGGTTRVFIPAMDRINDALPCHYVQHAAGMIASVFKDVEVISTPLLPGARGRERKLLFEQLAAALGRRESEVEAAYDEAEASLRFSHRLAAVPLPSDRPVAVIIGKPYNAADRFINLALPAKLARAGFEVVLADQLGVPDEGPLPPEYDGITWGFSRRMLRTAVALRERPNCFPVVVGNFGCGPDSFTIPLLEEEFGERPALILELDEHRADAGLDTRVEAFSQRAMRWLDRRSATSDGGRTEKATSAAVARTDHRGEYLIPYFSDHAYAFAGALRAEGVGARVLPMPGREVAEAGAEASGGKQCHPFQMIAGDVVRLARNGELPPNSVYLFPVSGGTCLITQYVPTIRRYLDTLGRPDVLVMGTSSSFLNERFGSGFLLNLGRGITAIEYLLRLRYELRPYEVRKGAVDEAYARALHVLVERQAAGDVHDGLMEAVFLMQQVETRNRGSRPVIGVAGDVYTRVNPAANGNLFDLLEELGCEVWLSPTLIDVALSKPESHAGRLPRYRELWESTYSWAAGVVKSMELWQVQKHFKGILRNLSEPDYEKVTEHVRGVLPPNSDVLLALNVAKHIDFANKKVDGILNVFCLNCMVGTSTAAVYPSLKEKTGDVPMMSLIFDGLGTTHTRNRIEAFVHRVERARRPGAPPPAPGRAPAREET